MIVDGIDAIDTPLDGLPIKDLTFYIDSFEERATQSNSLKRRGSYENSNTHKEGRVEELDIKQKIMLKLFSDPTKDFRISRPKIHCRPALRISGFHPGDSGSIPDNGILLFSYFILFYSFYLRLKRLL